MRVTTVGCRAFRTLIYAYTPAPLGTPGFTAGAPLSAVVLYRLKACRLPEAPWLQLIVFTQEKYQ